MQFPFTTTTDTHKIIEARQFGNRVRILVLGAAWSDVHLEWTSPLVAEQRVNKLIAQHSKKPKEVTKIEYKSKETILHEKRKTDLMRDDWEEWQGGNFDLLDFIG